MKLVALFLFSFSFQCAQNDTIQALRPMNFIKEGRSYIDSIKQDPAFDYRTDIPKIDTEIPWWTRLFNSTTGLIIKILMIVIFIYAIVIFVGERDINWLFKKKLEISVMGEAISSEVGNLNQFSKLIKEALKKKDYKLLVHYYYMHILHLLAYKKVITFSKEKTNMDYFYEISSNQIKEIFREFTREFDYIYYGEFAVSESMIQKISDQYQSMMKEMNF